MAKKDALTNNQQLLLERVVDDLNQKRMYEGDKFTGFSGEKGRLLHQSNMTVLEDLIRLNGEIPASTRRGIIHKALHSAAHEGEITLDSLKTQARQGESEYLRQKPQRLILLSNISIPDGQLLKRVRIRDLTITFPRKLPTVFKEQRDSILVDANHSFHSPPPTNYRWVRVSAWGRDSEAAVQSASNGLNFVIGLWNYIINGSVGVRSSFGGTREPVNQLGTGPIHTIHHPDGKLASQWWWYPSDYISPFKVKRIRQFDRVLEIADQIRAEIQRVPYRSEVEEFIRLYNAAFDERNLSTSYIRLWQVLERATRSPDNHGTIVKRVAALYKDDDYHRAMLDQLRYQRHSLVHEGGDSGSIETRLYLLKSYAETLLGFHIWNGHEFASLTEAMEILDLACRGDLKQRYLLTKQAAEFRGIKLP